ncbi:DNA/RNA helicase domain-containing protein [Bacillus subtilis]|uniref:DNA/RNA helicase domain-containing protein n=1 Tax=Bacillus subtilis TaxID=1423 RepID=UPI000BFFE0F3|nr:DNA/RNA helicase domain-containing protein [Bacillus subtilis]PLV34479.1 DNA replication protein DnaC [Bacillus subtilis subsp. subtilis]
MKPINLISLCSAKNKLSTSVFELYLNHFDIEVKEHELETIKTLILNLKHDDQLFEDFSQCVTDFYVGYSIPQISKEFDLLRISKNEVINIELKRESTPEKIEKQLIQNRWYLKALKKEVFNFTYTSQDNKLYHLNENGRIEEIDFKLLISKLEVHTPIHIEDLDNLFDPTNYLVSPFNSTDKFMGGNYFLTNHQVEIKNKILKSIDNGSNFFSIEGPPGSGKTLLTYDIAKEYINQSKKVLVIHVGILNEGHYKLISKYSWSIISISQYLSKDLSDYDLIILDEVQKIYYYQLENILNKVIDTDTKCIFSFDPQQCLTSNEINNKIPEYIEEKVSPCSFKLTNKIRTNKEIGSFIKDLLYLSSNSTNQGYSNIDIQYFNKSHSAKAYTSILKNKGWKIINYTPSFHGTEFPYDKYQSKSNETTHEVIGQEYDNVVAIIDKHFYYNEDGTLHTQGYRNNPIYHPTKMLFQMLTRARKKLCIIIINNEKVLSRCLNILNRNKK